MNYFKKVGNRSEEEQALLQAIEAVIEQKGIPRNEIPECQNLDDLIEVKFLVDAYEKKTEVEENPIIEETSNEIEQEEPNNEKESEQIIEDQDEIETQKIESDDNSSESINTESEIDYAEIIEEVHPEFDATDYNPFEQPIIERSYTSSNKSTDQEGHEFNSLEQDDLEESKEPTPLDNVNPNTKKKAAEQTADALLKGYARLVPKPFKWLAKVPEEKVEKLAFSGQLDLDIEVSDGVTFDDYMRQTNEQVDEIFEVDEDTLDEIREPLVEVLMEQQLELTPQQRLGMAVLSHLVQMFTVAIKLRSQNSRILAYQKELTRLSKTSAA